jgi:hypothetical protein
MQAITRPTLAATFATVATRPWLNTYDDRCQVLTGREAVTASDVMCASTWGPSFEGVSIAVRTMQRKA